MHFLLKTGFSRKYFSLKTQNIFKNINATQQIAMQLFIDKNHKSEIRIIDTEN